MLQGTEKAKIKRKIAAEKKKKAKIKLLHN
jgi:hypothetical protein